MNWDMLILPALTVAGMGIGLALDGFLFRARGELIAAQQRHVELLQDAVAAAQRVFEAYVELHLAKDTPEGRDKAAKNGGMARMLATALRLTNYRPRLRENVATPEGRELGAQLARFCDGEAKLQGRDGRCGTCAVRRGDHVANGSPETLMSFLKCVSERDPFWCHEENRPCAGYLLMRATPEEARPVPWPHSPGVD